ncbi:MAG: hypothetical protein ACYTKD_18670 [Planctomycetota bacterium]|jgi:hypothetical protein
MGAWDLGRVVAGPAEVTVGGVAVGRTWGPVKARFTPILREETCAYTGGTPVDFTVVGVRAEVTVTLAEHVLENLVLAMPHVLAASGYAGVGYLPGRRLAGGAAELTLHPVSRAAGDATEDVTLHRAVCVGVTELEYSNQADRLVEARFVGLADAARASGDMVGRVRAPERS